MIKDGSNAMWSWVEIEDGKVIVIIITIIRFSVLESTVTEFLVGNLTYFIS